MDSKHWSSLLLLSQATSKDWVRSGAAGTQADIHKQPCTTVQPLCRLLWYVSKVWSVLFRKYTCSLSWLLHLCLSHQDWCDNLKGVTLIAFLKTCSVFPLWLSVCKVFSLNLWHTSPITRQATLVLFRYTDSFCISTQLFSFYCSLLPLIFCYSINATFSMQPFLASWPLAKKACPLFSVTVYFLISLLKDDAFIVI